MPSTAPNTEITTASTVTIPIVCARRRPIARSRPSSRVRSSTDRARVLMMPSTAMMMASASRIWTIVSSWSSALVCWSMNASRLATDTSGLSASSAVHLRLHVGRPGARGQLDEALDGLRVAKSSSRTPAAVTAVDQLDVRRCR